jgi:hypothetical protein
MGWFRKDADPVGDLGDLGGEHAAPVQIDLGFQQRPWEVEMLVTQLEGDGLRLHLTTQSQVPELGGGLGPKRCMLLVDPADEQRLRAELQAAGFL